MKKLSKKEMKINEQIVKDLIEFIKSIYCWEDICIFYNNKAISSEDTWNVYKGSLITPPSKDEFGDKIRGVYEYTDIPSPKHWTTYANEETITVLFDGSFYDFINYRNPEKLNNLLEKYNAYYEQGEAFNFSIYFN